MVIKNSTPWSTADIRKLFRRCVKEVDKVEKPRFPFHRRNKSFQLDVMNTSRGRSHGRATIDGYWIMIKIPKDWILKLEYPKKPNAICEETGRAIYYAFNSNLDSIRVGKNNTKPLDRYYWDVVGELDELELEHRQELARLMIHEYYHTIGSKSIDHKNYKNDFTKNWNVDWVKDYPIGKKEVVQEPQVDIKLVRYQRAIENLRRAETRLRRAKTLHKKWRDKVKYYERKYNFKV